MRRMGRPSLVGTVARTAVIAGTATAVSGGMQRRSAGKQQQAQVDAQVQAALAAQTAQQAAVAPPAAAPAPEVDVVAELQKYAALRDSGILTEEEFAAQKAKILAL